MYKILNAGSNIPEDTDETDAIVYNKPLVQ